MLIVNSNIPALNAANHLKTNAGLKAKSTEKLSSGYQIGKAADNPAGLAISEKMRTMIKGLGRGTKNMEDGASWVQTGDGALDDAHAILHRMSELTIQSLNDTNTDLDRMALEKEFESLQSELDRIGNTTKFNDMPIFEAHESPFYQYEGNIHWDPHQIHSISAGNNDLSITYQADSASGTQTKTITVPPGEYTTQELIDEIEDALGPWTPGEANLVVELTPEGTCNVNVEGGENIEMVSGGLSYLLNQIYWGGNFGALIGTTIFPDEFSRLEVVNGQNNFMSFEIQDFSGNSQLMSIDIPDGEYTRSELIDILNQQLQGTSVAAEAWGTGIKLSSDDAIVTGFKGNMFKIDGGYPIYNSVFYDNVKYGSVSQSGAVFTGGCVLPTDPRDEEHSRYVIDDSNRTLVLYPNGSTSPVTIDISPGSYTAEEMRDKLNTLFGFSGLQLTVDVVNANGFKGLRISSDIKGFLSSVKLDPGCSAYGTLFVKREYNQYGNPVRPQNETKTDKEATFTGSKNLGGLSAVPLIVTAGVNDAFSLTINDTEYTIHLTPNTYTSIDQVVAELNQCLNGPSTPLSYKGMINVSASGSTIRLTGADGKNVDKINVKAVNGNGGFDEVFQGYTFSTVSQPASGTGSVILNTPFDGNIDASNNSFDINVDGTNYPIKLPTGSNVTQDQIINAIESAIPPRTETTPNTFSPVSAVGSNSDRNFSKTGNGTQSATPWSGSATGSSVHIEGQVGFTDNKPATLTLGPSLKNSMTLDDSNNKITLTLNNGQPTVIELNKGPCTPASLIADLQQKIDQAFGTSMGGATVQLGSDNKLVITSRLPDGYNGAKTSISCSTANSSFLKDLNTTKNPASLTTTQPLASSITIDGIQTFQFKLKEPQGTFQNVSVDLGPGSFTPASIAEQITKKLAASGVGALASVTADNRLVLTSATAGSGVSISYDSRNGGTATEALFGSLTTPKPADRVVPLDTEDSITIEAGTSDQFSISVNGKDKNLTLTPGTYDRNSFVNMLNEKLKDANADLEAYVSGNKIGYRTKTTGNQAFFSVNYNNGGSSMKSIYGETTKNYPGVTASFNSQGNLVLGSTNPNSTITVPSSNGSPFQKPEVITSPIQTSSTNGYHSSTYSQIAGTSLNGDITINQWNNSLSFQFTDAGIPIPVNFDVPDGTYGYAELKTLLQNLVDAQVGGGKINVSVDAGGVKLTAVKAGNNYQFNNFKGDFFDKVMCPYSESTSSLNTAEKPGGQAVDTAYTIGRKDVKTNGATIRPGISDTLSLDFKCGPREITLEMQLDPKKYSGQELIEHLQEKLNEQLVKNGLPENLIEVGLGGINSGVSGSNDQNAINFKLSETVSLPEEGEYVIDGVSGNAAFEIFYQTDGEMIPAYIVGTKDISEGVTLGPDDTLFSLNVDGTDYSITLPEGSYTPEELIKQINAGLTAQGAPLVASVEDDHIKISHTLAGEHTIDQVSGGAKDNIFFTERGQLEEKPGRYIKPNSQSGDHIVIKRQIFSSAYLGVNSICISRPKYANKALDRLSHAVDMVSEIRSEFGTMQNRLGYAINNNENMQENTQRAESSLRDTDMTKEIVNFAKCNILQQAGEAMLSQAHQAKERVLMLLQ